MGVTTHLGDATCTMYAHICALLPRRPVWNLSLNSSADCDVLIYKFYSIAFAKSMSMTKTIENCRLAYGAVR